jgi:hypothetical protein
MSAHLMSYEVCGKFEDPQGSLSSFLGMLSPKLRDYIENIIADTDDNELLTAIKVFWRFPSGKDDWFILPESEPKGSKRHPPLAEGLLMVDWEVLALREAEERRIPLWSPEELDQELIDNIPEKHVRKAKKHPKPVHVEVDSDDVPPELLHDADEDREPTMEDLLKEETPTDDPLVVPLENPPEESLVNPIPEKRKQRATLSLPSSEFGLLREFLKSESVAS